MASRPIVLVCLAAGVLLVPSKAAANGFFLYETSPKTTAEGGAAVADGAEASTVLYNPAAMTRLPGFRAELNLYTYFATTSFTNPKTGNTTDAEPGIFPIPAAYITYKPIDWLAIGFGAYSNFGLTLTWPEGWEGASLVETASLRSYSVQPSIAFGQFEGFSFGGGLQILKGALDIIRSLPLASGQTGKAELGGGTVGYGANIGLHYEPIRYVRAGISYRSPIRVSLDSGEATFNVPAVYDQQLRGQGFRASILLPGMLIFGARVTPIEELQIEIDGQMIQWDSYKALTFEFDDPSLSQSQAKDWHNAWEFRIGAQYEIDDLALRIGFLFDQTPQPDETVDPTLPDNNRLIPGAGLGYQFLDWLRGDLGYHFVYVLPREVDASVNSFPGKYDVMVHTLVVGLGVKLDDIGGAAAAKASHEEPITEPSSARLNSIW
jgi:long-chain fatty acid transport protein